MRDWSTTRTDDMEALSACVKELFSEGALLECRTEKELVERCGLFELTNKTQALEFFYEVGVRCVVAAWYGCKVNIPADGSTQARAAAITQVAPEHYVSFLEESMSEYRRTWWLPRLLRRFASWLV